MRSINPLVDAAPVLLTCIKVALIYASISQCLSANSLLHVVNPLAFVALAGAVLVDAVAVGFISLEVAVKDVPVCVIEDAFTLCFAITPLAHILCAVLPSLGSVAVLALGR